MSTHHGMVIDQAEALPGFAVLRRLHRWDTALFFRICHPNRHRMIRRAMMAVSRSGDGPLYVVLFGLFALTSPALGLPLFGKALLAFTVEVTLYKGLKHLFKRSRPCTRFAGLDFLLPPPDQYSFPSGHTAAAFVAAGMLAPLFPALALPLYIWAGLVGYSRVYAGVHYPLDVVAGAILGHVCVLFSSYHL